MNPRTDAAVARHFLTKVWPDPLPPGAELLLWREPKQRSSFFTTAQAAAIKAVMLAKQADMYFGIGLREAGISAKRRGGNQQVLWLPGFAADLDAAKSGNPKNYPPTKSAVAEIVAQMPLQPTLLWDSGGGLQGLWLFDEPWDLTSIHERAVASVACREFGRAMHDHFVQAGYVTDHASDLARHLRVPGTINHGREALVTIAEERVETRCGNWQEILDSFNRDVAAITQAKPEIEFNAKHATLPMEGLNAETNSVIASIPEARRLMSGDLSNPDASSGDYRLTKLLEAHGVSEPQRRAAVSERRRHVPQHREKAESDYYLKRTAKSGQTSVGRGKYVPLLVSSHPNRLQVLDAALHHSRDWLKADHLTPTHALLLCELSGWCGEGTTVTVAVDVLARNLHLSRQWVAQLLRDLRRIGCISFDPAFNAAKNNLRPITLNVSQDHAEHVNSALPVAESNASTGLHPSPSEHVNPALPKSSQGGEGS